MISEAVGFGGGTAAMWSASLLWQFCPVCTYEEFWVSQARWFVVLTRLLLAD